MARPPFSLRPRTTWALVVLACLLRLAVFAHGVSVHPDVLQPRRERIEAHFDDPDTPFVSRFGFEASGVAWSLVCGGGGFASPFGGATGPTGWVSPGLVAPWALAFRLFGCFTSASVLALFGVALAAALATVALGAGAAARLHRNRRAGIVAGLALAVSPWDLSLFHARSLLDPDLTVLAVTALLALLLRLVDRPGAGTAAGYAAFAGVAALVNPTILLPAALGLAVALVPGRKRRGGEAPAAAWRRAAVGVALFAAGQLLIVGPWLVHQRRALGGWSYVKTNLPFELDLGNLEEVDGVYVPRTFTEHHPSASVEEYRRYRRLGERAYVAAKLERFRAGLDPVRFLRATARRAAHALFLSRPQPWQGALSRAVRAAMAPVPGLVLLLYPLLLRLRGRRLGRRDAAVYAVALGYLLPFLAVAVAERYLLPFLPPMLVLAAGLVPSEASPGGSSERRTRTVSSGSDDGANRAPVGSGRFS